MRRKTVITGAAGLGAVAVLVTACTTVQPSIGQYAIVTGHGAFSNQLVKDVLDPGQKIHVSGSDQVWYLPANVRNYVTAQSGLADRKQGIAAKTASSSAGPGMPVYTYSYVSWELNPNHQVLKQFFPFCLKYACAGTHAQNDTGNQGLAHSSVPGWNSMLAEIFPTAIDGATRDALAKFGPGLWADQSQWPAFGDWISRYLPAELAKLTGTSSAQYFCGPGSTPGHCAPFTVIIKDVTPVDNSVVTAYNQQITAAYLARAGAARLKAAQEVYGSQASYWLGWQDTVNSAIRNCQHVQSCTIIVGSPPQLPRP